ncbi:MAG: DNA mismatch repair protein MutS [Alphaproteobacteria bacterium]|nr:DNA mismatch repair protein MutS [Alphaproteobacteria bacterium]
MMSQFLDVKTHYQDFLLFYRMGDFYEMFFHDAEIASASLGIALTKRGQMDGKDIPMCGVPVHAMDGYLEKLIRLGHRVAVCEQAETPEMFKKRGGKGPLPRAVVRVVTAGTLNEDGLLAPTQNNYLAAIGHANGEFAIAWADMSTGSFQVQAVKLESILTTIERLNPAEILFPETQDAIVDCLKGFSCAFPIPNDSFESSNSEQNIKKFFGDDAHETAFSRAQFSAISGILNYLSKTQISEKPFLVPPILIDKNRILEIDPATRRSLEITRTLSGEKKGCLLDTIDKTKTAIGARLLASRIASPLAVKPEIDERLDLVSWFLSQNIIKTEIGELLKGLPDFERSLARLSVGRGGPRDLFSLATAIEKAQKISKIIEQAVTISSSELLADIGRVVSNPYSLSLKIKDALAENLPLLPREGQFIRAGFDKALDSLCDLRDESRRHIALLQREYSEATGISSLKVKHNNVLGYHIEVRSNHADKLMSEEQFIHRQTTAQAVRFTTTALGQLERELATAADRALAIELSLFDGLVEETLKCQASIACCASIIAQIDVAIATALLAEQHHYVRPDITNDTQFMIESGRHPVVETMSGQDTPFMANDCTLTQGQKIWLVTGPNMAGKSTFLRQNAHFLMLAQAGLFVPAKKAEIGIVDKLFSRVGASDDLARGQSTFMVEMVETAVILNQATPKSLVILDEIGRGTSTYDGLSIAHATLEHLHNVNRCRGLFATHYHELTILEDTLADVESYHMLIKEWNQQVIFLYQVAKGRAGRSYGIHVAKLAGLPELVIERAKNILSELENQGWKDGQSGADNSVNLPLFSQTLMPTIASETNVQYEELLALLQALQPDDLSPKEALNVLYELHKLCKEGHE